MLTHRRSVDRARHVMRSVERDHRVAWGAEAVVDDVESTGVARMEALELRAAVRTLPTRQRDALVLTFFDGYSQEQAAQALRVPLGTLKSRVHAAVTSLRRHYASLEVGAAAA